MTTPLAGIGATLIADGGKGLRIGAVDALGPAKLSGLIHVDDRLLAIRVANRWQPAVTVDEAEHLLFGSPGETVRLRIQRDSIIFDVMLELELPRAGNLGGAATGFECKDESIRAKVRSTLESDLRVDPALRMESGIMHINGAHRTAARLPVRDASQGHIEPRDINDTADSAAAAEQAARAPEASPAALPTASTRGISGLDIPLPPADPESAAGSNRAESDSDAASASAAAETPNTPDTCGGGGGEEEAGGAEPDGGGDDDGDGGGVTAWLPWGLTPTGMRTVSVRSGRRAAAARPAVWGILREGVAALLRRDPAAAAEQRADRV
jgi:hypothetical protein